MSFTNVINDILFSEQSFFDARLVSFDTQAWQISIMAINLFCPYQLTFNIFYQCSAMK